MQVVSVMSQPVYPQQKALGTPLYRKLTGLQSQYGRFAKKRKICPTVTKLNVCFENGTSTLGNAYAKMLHFCNINPILNLENCV
jgi:hypothetical protein